MKPTIHRCDHAQQKSVHLVCTDTWTEPMWATGLKNVHKADTDDLYTFDANLVTCISCQLLAEQASAGSPVTTKRSATSMDDLLVALVGPLNGERP